ncbi:hypothetical protein SRHO_G00268050 [Serrasalmus rhombeus]
MSDKAAQNTTQDQTCITYERIHEGPCWIQREMGSAESRSNTHVANATDKHLRIYYQTSKMTLEELVVKADAGLGFSNSTVSGNVNTSTTMVFKPDSRVRYLRLPPREFTNFAGEGELFASVLVEDKTNPEVYLKCICMNFHVPSDRSFIVTASENIKLQKYGASVWVDENGVRH